MDKTDKDLEQLWSAGIKEFQDTSTKGLVKPWEKKVAEVGDGYPDEGAQILQDGSFLTDPNPDWNDVLSGSYVPRGFDEVQRVFTDAPIHDDILDGPTFTSVQELVASKVPTYKAGTRVMANLDLECMLTYPNIPATHVAGTVVTVRTGSGDSTEDEGRVFVAWDDGEFRPMYAQHLKLAPNSIKRAGSFRIVASSLGDIGGFFESSSGNDLVHKATRDLWSFKKEGDDYVIERLFTDTGKPLKV